MKQLFMFSSLLVTLNLSAAYTNDTIQNQKKTDLQSMMSSQSQQDRYTTPNDETLAYHIRRQISQVTPESRDIILYIDKGDVKLMGKVRSEAVKRQIADAAQKVKGVKSIVNRLEVQN